MLPGTDESYWMRTTPVTSHRALTGELDVDVAVVGGGIAGLCTAWELAVAGRSVAVLEADRIAAGVTGHTTAKLTALHTLAYSRIRSTSGPVAARLYATSQQEAVEHVVEMTQALGIECDLERVPAFTYAESADALESVRDEADAAAEAGLDASFVTETDLPFPVAGAVRVDDQAQLHPRKYLLALADDLVRHGGRIFEHTRVVDLREGDPCRLTTEDGATVRARDVVVATHHPVFDRALLFTRLEPRRELVVAASIPERDDPGGMYITTEDRTRSVRTAPYGDGRRLLIVTGEHFIPGTGGVTGRFERLAAWTRDRFPRSEVRFRWAAQDNSTTDHLPYVGRFHPGTRHVHVAAGFGGWGMSNGVMSGRLLAASITGEAPPWAALYDPVRLHPRVDTGSMLRLQATVVRHFVGDRLRAADVASVDDLAPGKGAVLRIDGDRCAVYRDATGRLHGLSARCTHLGCIVTFNDAERAWECPCHGSRFGIDGAVIQGPANRPLAPKDVV